MLGRSNTHSHTPFLCLESIHHLLNKSDDGDPLQFVMKQDPRGGRGFHMPVFHCAQGGSLDLDWGLLHERYHPAKGH